MWQRTNSVPSRADRVTPKRETDPHEVDGRSERYVKIAKDTLDRLGLEPEGRELILNTLALPEALLNAAANAVLRAGPYVERIWDAQQINGYEDLFAKRLGYPPLMNRFLAHAVLQLGEQVVQERNDARPSGVNPLLTKLAKPSAKSLSASRAAKRLLVVMRGGAVRAVLTRGLEEAGLAYTYLDFKALVERVSHRDEAAVDLLRNACRSLRLKLSDPSGPPLRYETGVHLVLTLFLKNLNKVGAYTYTVNGKMENAKTEWLSTRSHDNEDDNNFHDYIDEVTLATRQALNNTDFSPSRSALLLNSGQFLLADGSVPRSRSKRAARKVS